MDNLSKEEISKRVSQDCVDPVSVFIKSEPYDAFETNLIVNETKVCSTNTEISIKKEQNADSDEMSVSYAEEQNNDLNLNDKKINPNVSDDEDFNPLDVCATEFESHDNLSKNSKTVREKPNKKQGFKCSECGKIFSQKGNLKIHLSNHFGGKRFKCSECDKSFCHKSHLQRHMLAHSDTRPHKCDICNKAFKQKYQLDDHKFCHTNERPHVCKLCGKYFKRKGDVQQHKRVVHSGNISENSCSDGNTSGQEKCNENDDTKKFPCKLCGKIFSRKGNLDTHLKNHNDPNPFKCLVCKKGFRHKSHLLRHMLVHSNDRPHKCDLCNKAFKQKFKLYEHKFCHSTERPHYCVKCGKNYKSKGDLRQHERFVHTGNISESVSSNTETSIVSHKVEKSVKDEPK